VANDFSKHHDDELVLLGNRGAQAAFHELYARYKQKIINFGYRMLRDRDAAADVLQETFEYFFRKIPDYRPEGKLAILLFRVARNICLNKLKRSRSRRELPLEEAAITPEDTGAQVSAPLEAQELQSSIAAALEKMPVMYSEVIILRILKGLPVAQVAQVVECPEGTVKSRLHNGLELLRKKLKVGDFR
jgi:RNA polymerase sigma-70 factor (ECF subfamily)